MPRQPRLDAPGTLHPVIGRGIEGSKIFRNRGDRRREVVGLRKVFCQVAVKGLGYSGASVVRFLGVTTSLVNRMANSEKESNLDQYQ